MNGFENGTAHDQIRVVNKHKFYTLKNIIYHEMKQGSCLRKFQRIESNRRRCVHIMFDMYICDNLRINIIF